VPRSMVVSEVRITHQLGEWPCVSAITGRARDPASNRGVRERAFQREPVRARRREGAVSIGESRVSQGGQGRSGPSGLKQARFLIHWRTEVYRRWAYGASTSSLVRPCRGR